MIMKDVLNNDEDKDDDFNDGDNNKYWYSL